MSSALINVTETEPVTKGNPAKTRRCDECLFFYYVKGTNWTVCLKGHKPRFYMPRSDYDYTCGYKRRCADFQPADMAQPNTQ